MTKAPTPTEKPKKQRDNTQTPPKTSITQRIVTVVRTTEQDVRNMKKTWLQHIAYSPERVPLQLGFRRRLGTSRVWARKNVPACQK